MPPFEHQLGFSKEVCNYNPLVGELTQPWVNHYLDVIRSFYYIPYRLATVHGLSVVVPFTRYHFKPWYGGGAAKVTWPS